MAAKRGTVVESALYQTLTRYNLHHIFLWVLYFFFWVYVISPGISSSDLYINSLVIVGVQAIVSYFNIYFLFPVYLQRRQYVLYFVAIVLAISLGTLLESSAFLILGTTSMEVKAGLLSPQYLLVTALTIGYTVAITMSLKLVKHWYEKERLTKELEKLNTETELKYLKSQINPHFLFNSLNSVYALALQKSDLAPDLILKLSDILRYILYEGSEKKVGLAQEVKYLKSYLELEKVRHGERMDLSMEIEGDVDAHEIAPMLLIPFVENSFKHGLGKNIAKGYVKLLLKVTTDKLHFEIANSKPKNGSEVAKQKGYNGGIGLINVRRRLRLLYPKKHVLEIDEASNEYKVSLDINLN